MNRLVVVLLITAAYHNCYPLSEFFFLTELHCYYEAPVVSLTCTFGTFLGILRNMLFMSQEFCVKYKLLQFFFAP